MLKKRKQESDEHADNHERWLVSYADFITLLFAFFIVMYAVSSVNEGKYRVLSSSLVSAFKSDNSSNLAPSKATEFSPISIQQLNQTDSIKLIDNLSFQRTKKQEKMKSMAKNILHALEPLVKDGQVRVTQSSLGITVEINASVLFSPGQAKLADNSSLTLQAVAHVIKGHEHEIHVEGHTDNLPIQTENFPSNWELSSARASSVIRLFIENGVEAHRLTALGYGENRPIETNETPEGRKRNRRVTVMIMSADPDKVTEIPIVEY
ncbi:MAG: flagellar motor protein MotD [Nitrosomonas sp.]|uniref:flagellar motor protein MotD n=1 Tax=Nitrosomonas sp. TaxID=42353 RepID=UPI0027188143|nr:flagellar motor protein MotD [Nitrosomonas sp.]MDO8894832.1 flagellar motor protein MotD [Nitrosomonas sp.]MDO9469256.1 flagellar motor protein MotD [Nitrosomonas sp.]MDP3281024.1 flagellar motor protein MotD [Nitrosomonas sp.]MDP3664843.1 flagellar motor protein MotD [Nitrosomonas sp.]MDZ4105312.1 flagellar motor protein MotD [Nitrosomonas sp.]